MVFWPSFIRVISPHLWLVGAQLVPFNEYIYQPHYIPRCSHVWCNVFIYIYVFLKPKENKKQYIYIYVPWAPKTMKNKGFGHLKDEVFFAIKTSKHVGFGGPKVYIIHQVKKWPHEQGEMAWVTLGWDFFQLQAYSETELNQFGLSGRLSDVLFQEEKTPYFFGGMKQHTFWCLLFVWWCFLLVFFSHEVFLSGGKSRLGPESKSFPVPKKKPGGDWACWGGEPHPMLTSTARWWFQLFSYFHPEHWGRWTHFD